MECNRAFTETNASVYKAAEQGNARAQATLNELYELDDGFGRDVAVAVGWYRKAGEPSNLKSQRGKDMRSASTEDRMSLEST